MRLRQLNLLAVAATLVTIPYFAANLRADKKPKAKPAEASTAAAPAVSKPEIPDLEFVTRLRQEEYGHGQVMDLMSYLTDQIGARLTGSPNMKKANEWTRDKFTKWGLVNAHLEPWGTFGAVGVTDSAKCGWFHPTSCSSWRSPRPGRPGPAALYAPR